ncbi:MAG: glycoside hydrolase family 3 C-terminal domain-containing protein, partial [Bacteroidota bacterium]
REMFDLYLEPFRVAFQEAHAKGTMASYNDYDGIPIISSKYFLTEILRKQFGFDGYVVSDSHALEDLYTKHFVAADLNDAARMALEAGLNVRTNFSTPLYYINAIRFGVKNGTIPISLVDERVKEVLRVKFWMGLFDHPYVENPKAADKTVHSKEAQELSLRAARESIVLLKNENNLLPINNKEKIKTVAIIGPNAKEYKSLTSRYAPVYPDIIKVYDGIAAELPNTKILYAKGCEHVDKNFPLSDIEDFDLTKEETDLINEAVDVASKSDMVFLVVGDGEKTIGEGKSRLNLKLPGRQDDLVKKIAELNKPTVMILVNGRPATINYANRHIPAIIESWYLGETTGKAIADVIFGNYNPGGKLSVPFIKHVGQIPLSFPMKSSADGNGDANVSGFIYPFGFGLSYTTFQYNNLKINTDNYKSKGKVEISFTIKNTGKIKGDEVVQLYIHDEVCSVTTYEKHLRGFDRITLSPNEQKIVRFDLTANDFSILNKDMQRVVEPGWFTIMIGASSENICLNSKFELK